MTLELGGDVPTTSYSYFRWSGDDGVYMCDSGLTDALLTTATRLLPVEQPTLSKDLIDQVTLSRADGETAVLLSNDGDGHYTGLLVEPYQYPVDPEQAEALLTALSSFRLGTREAEANAETRAQYGLDDPELTLWLHQAAGTVGQVDENGQLAAVEVREQALRFVIGRAEGEFSIPANTQAAAIWSAAFCWRRCWPPPPIRWWRVSPRTWEAPPSAISSLNLPWGMST